VDELVGESQDLIETVFDPVASFVGTMKDGESFFKGAALIVVPLEPLPYVVRFREALLLNVSVYSFSHPICACFRVLSSSRFG
jgi:hypothetical protein